MAVLTVVATSRAGVDPGFTAAANGDVFDNTNKPTVKIRCGATACTPSFAFGDDIDTVVAGPRAGSECPANEEREYGPFPDFPYSDTGRLVTITYSATADVEVAVTYPGPIVLDNTP